MRSIRLFFALVAALGFGGLAQATPVSLEAVEIGEDLAEKTEEYGARDIERLAENLTEAITERLEREGHTLVSDDSMVRVAITLDDAWPNRPTRAQLADEPALSFRSISLGGASVKAVLYDHDGNTLGALDYSWRTRSIEDSVGMPVWHDAERTFDRFARQLAEQIPADAS